MKKMKTLFERVYENNKIVNLLNVVTPGNEWVNDGEGIATLKLDGTCTLIEEGKIYRRYDCKTGRTPPDNFIPCCEPDESTGHWPGWIEMNIKEPKGDICFWMEALNGKSLKDFENGTYELCGPKINANRECLNKHVLIKHGSIILGDCPRDYDGLKQYLLDNVIEGIVFHRQNDENDMCKIKRSDFGLKWGNKNKEIK